MTALTSDNSRSIFGGNQGSRVPLKASEITFVGSLMSRNASGFVNRLAAGESFAGVCQQRIIANDWKSSGAADGDLLAQLITGRFFMLVTGLTGVVAADAQKRRKVYASDDATFSLSAAVGNTYIGDIVEFVSSTSAIVECATAEERDSTLGVNGFLTLADADATLTSAHVGKVLHVPQTAARTITLPPAADWIGQSIVIVNTGGAFGLICAANGAEKVGEAASQTLTATAGRSIAVMSTGVASHEVAILAKQ